MASLGIVRTIEALADACAVRAALAAAYEAKKADIMRHIADELAALDAEYTPLLAAADAQIKTLAQDIRAAVLQPTIHLIGDTEARCRLVVWGTSARALRHCLYAHTPQHTSYPDRH